MTPSLIYYADGCEIWHGDSLNPEHVSAIMGDRKADLLNVDAPYSERTHSGHNEGARQSQTYGALTYDYWTPHDVWLFVNTFAPYVSGWWCSTTDHVLAPAWTESLENIKLYTFAPLPWVETGSRVRLAGDGPSNWTCWLVVARPRSKPYSKWGTLRGAYILPAENHQTRPDRIIGGKSIVGTKLLIEDYSRPGDLVLDPCLGGGTTMIAARMCGRRCIGIERDLERAELCARLMLDGARKRAPEEQTRLF